MSFFAWRWSQSDEDFIPEARFLTKADGDDHISYWNKTNPWQPYVGAIIEERPGDREVFDAFEKARDAHHKALKALRDHGKRQP